MNSVDRRRGQAEKCFRKGKTKLGEDEGGLVEYCSGEGIESSGKAGGVEGSREYSLSLQIVNLVNAFSLTPIPLFSTTLSQH